MKTRKGNRATKARTGRRKKSTTLGAGTRTIAKLQIFQHQDILSKPENVCSNLPDSIYFFGHSPKDGDSSQEVDERVKATDIAAQFQNILRIHEPQTKTIAKCISCNDPLDERFSQLDCEEYYCPLCYLKGLNFLNQDSGYPGNTSAMVKSETESDFAKLITANVKVESEGCKTIAESPREKVTSISDAVDNNFIHNVAPEIAQTYPKGEIYSCKIRDKPVVSCRNIKEEAIDDTEQFFLLSPASKKPKLENQSPTRCHEPLGQDLPGADLDSDKGDCNSRRPTDVSHVPDVPSNYGAHSVAPSCALLKLNSDVSNYLHPSEYTANGLLRRSGRVFCKNTHLRDSAGYTGSLYSPPEVFLTRNYCEPLLNPPHYVKDRSRCPKYKTLAVSTTVPNSNSKVGLSGVNQIPMNSESFQIDIEKTKNVVKPNTTGTLVLTSNEESEDIAHSNVLFSNALRVPGHSELGNVEVIQKDSSVRNINLPNEAVSSSLRFVTHCPADRNFICNDLNLCQIQVPAVQNGDESSVHSTVVDPVANLVFKAVSNDPHQEVFSSSDDEPDFTSSTNYGETPGGENSIITKTYVCPVCPESFTRTRRYHKHLWKHGKEKSFGCEACDQKFETAGALCAHELNHTDSADRYKEGNLRCRGCNVIAVSFAELEKHACFSLREFGCLHCPLVFAGKTLRDEHARSHSTKKKKKGSHFCTMCNKVFSLQKTLLQHNKVVHQGLEAIKGKVCNTTYNCKSMDLFASHRCEENETRSGVLNDDANVYLPDIKQVSSTKTVGQKTVRNEMITLSKPTLDSIATETEVDDPISTRTRKRPWKKVVSSDSEELLSGSDSDFKINNHDDETVSGEIDSSRKKPALKNSHKKTSTFEIIDQVIPALFDTRHSRSSISDSFNRNITKTPKVIPKRNLPSEGRTPKRNKITDHNLPFKSNIYRKYIYRCPSCTMTFKEIRFYKAHLEMHKKNKSFSCLTCDHKFQTAGAMSAHELTHTNMDYTSSDVSSVQDSSFKNQDAMFRCRACDMTTSSIRELEAHDCYQTCEFRCPHCVQSFSEEIARDNHAKSCSTSKESKHCTLCNEAFSCESTLLDHEQAFHETLNSFRCDFCNKTWPDMDNFRSHHCSQQNDSIGHDSIDQCHSNGVSITTSHKDLNVSELSIGTNQWEMQNGFLQSEKETGSCQFENLNGTIQSERDTETTQSESDAGDHQSEEKIGIQETGTLQLGNNIETVQLEKDIGVFQMDNKIGTLQLDNKTGTQHSEKDIGTLQSKSETGTQQLQVDMRPHQSVDENKVWDSIEDSKVHKHNTRGKLFDNNVHVLQHDNTRTNAKAFKCKTCTKSWYIIDSFNRHRCQLPLKPPLVSIIGSTNIKCPACPRVLVRNCLKSHLRKHAVDKTFRCDVCSRVFKTTGAMSAHKLTHNPTDGQLATSTSNQQPSLKCSVCNLAFRTVLELEKHMCYNLTKRFKCLQCPEAFFIESKLDCHVRRQHSKMRTKMVTDNRRVFHDSDEGSSADLENRAKMWNCTTCGKVFKDRQMKNYVLHLWRHRNKKDFRCKFCGETFATAGNMCAHELTHKNIDADDLDQKKDGSPEGSQQPTVYECRACGIPAATVFQLETHVCFNITEVSCPHCPEVFPYQRSLDVHTRKHLPESERKVFACTDCDKVLSCEKSLENHEKVFHKAITHYRCKICTRMFWVLENFQKHKCEYRRQCPAKLIAKQTVECQVCHKTVISTSVKAHMQSHANVRKFECETCGKRFKLAGTLKIHALSHSSELYEMCDLCAKSFKRSYSLKRHVDSVHNKKENSFHCDVCGKDFAPQDNYVRHLRTHTGEKPYECRICGHRTIQYSTLKSHIKVHHKDAVVADAMITHFATAGYV